MPTLLPLWPAHAFYLYLGSRTPPYTLPEPTVVPALGPTPTRTGLRTGPTLLWTWFPVITDSLAVTAVIVYRALRTWTYRAALPHIPVESKRDWLNG